MNAWLADDDLTLYHGDALDVLRTLPAGIAQTCVTSPPYWGLRDYGTGDAQLGLEATPDQYVAKMVEVFREVRRVLRDDGTLWLNIGDSYATGTGTPSKPSADTDNGYWQNADKLGRNRIDGRQAGLKPKDLVGIPWRLAFALQQDGWYLRSDIIWSKPNPMPESVTDRPTKAHEYLFLLTKASRYFYDADAVREPHESTRWGGRTYDQPNGVKYDTEDPRVAASAKGREGRTFDHYPNGGRNLRSVWQIATQPFPEAHFATYPEELVQRCIQAGTSERGGCAECGAPWRRVTSTEYENPGNRTTNGDRSLDRRHETAGFPVRLERRTETTGWEPSCDCDDNHYGRPGDYQPPPPIPQLVLDPFIGSGTTSLVARKHGRRSIGIDLSADYLAIAAKRTQQLSLLGLA